MHSLLKNPMVLVCISAAVFSTSLLAPFTVVNSHVWKYEYSDTYTAPNDYHIKNLNFGHELTPTTYSQGKSNYVLNVEFSEEDFTGDSVSFLVNANNVDK